MATIHTDILLDTRASANVRVLELLQNTTDAEGIHYNDACRVHVVPADTKLSYAAVSYMWGDATTTAHILVNRQPFRVRLNLLELLEELKARRYRGFLWIDAICIDQSSILEHNHQVAIMGKIFTKASRVIVWLGIPTEDMKCSLEFLEDPRPTSKNRGVIFELQLRGIRDICSHPYWSRAWIFQEVVLAIHVELYCGTHSVPLLKLNKLCKTLGGRCYKGLVTGYFH